MLSYYTLTYAALLATAAFEALEATQEHEAALEAMFDEMLAQEILMLAKAEVEAPRLMARRRMLDTRLYIINGKR